MRFWSRKKRGQAMVETAIVLPLNLFVMLGIIQYGLISHARVLAKYAAYRAVRVGVMNHASVQKMRDAAFLTLLPVIATPYSGAKVAGAEVILPTTNASEFGQKLIEVGLAEALVSGIAPNFRTVDVKICGPLRGQVAGQVDQAALGAMGGTANQVDFDDYRASTEAGPSGSGGISNSYTTLRQYLRTKLRIQVQFKYRMPIPFANWVISYAYLGQQLPDVMRMERSGWLPKLPPLANQLWYAANILKIYIAPINVSYSMRMQSNFMLNKFPLPQKNDCAHYQGTQDET